MTTANSNTVKSTSIRLVSVNPEVREAAELTEVSLTWHEMELIKSFRAVRPDYALCLLTSVAALAEEYPANPAPKMQLVRA